MGTLANASTRLHEPWMSRHGLGLAKVVHASFCYTHTTLAGVEERRLRYKLTVSRKQQLVASHGHRDPLEALIAYHHLVLIEPWDGLGEERCRLTPLQPHFNPISTPF